MTIRDLRQRWPVAEALLEREKEIIITRDSKPVARLIKIEDPPQTRERFSPQSHKQWQKRLSGKSRLVDKYLIADRDEA